MANPLSGILGKIKTVGGKAVDIAGKGALYSQMYRNPNEKLTIGQRVGGAVTDMALNATLGQMGSLGDAVRTGITSKQSKTAPTGGSGVGSTSVPYTPIKTPDVVQAINQSTQQTLRGLNIVNSTFRSGLNNTTNQIQSQSSVMEAVKSDTEDMDISLREIYEVLNKQGYENRNTQNLSGGAQRVDAAPVVSSNQNNQGILQDLITGALLSAGSSLVTRMLPMISSSAIPALGGLLTHFFDSDSSKAGGSIVGSWINENIPGAASIDDFIFRMSGGIAGTDMNDPRYSWNQPQPQNKNPNKSRAEAVKTPTATELTKAEIDEIFRLAPINAPDNVLFEIAKQKFPGRKYNTLKQRIEMLRSLMQPQSSLSTGVNVASTDMSSGSYLANRQMMLDNTRSQTSEQALRQEEQELEESAFKGVIPQLLNYESREMMYKADKIVFDAGKIEFLEGMGMGGEGEGGPGGGLEGPGGPAGNGSGGPSGGDASRVPELSAETKAAAEQLQKSNTFKVAPGASDPLGQYSDEQLRSQGIVSHTNKDGAKVYSYAPGGIGGHADKIGGSGASQAVSQPGGYAGLGSLSAQYESGKRGSSAIGFDSTGGTSYGKYQIASRTGTMNNFLEYAKTQNPEVYERLKGAGASDTGSTSGQFVNEWKKLVAEGKMGNLEHDFIKASHYDKAMEKIKDPELRKMIEQNPALQDVMWSTAVQHGPADKKGGAAQIFNQAYKPGMSSEDLIKGVYSSRRTKFGSSSSKVQASVQARFDDEQKKALAMNKNPPAMAGSATGPTAQAPNLAAGLQGMAPANQTAAAGSGVGPGNVAVKEAYGPRRPERPDESIRNIASSAAEKAGMSAITFTSGKGDWISPERRAGGQQTTQHSTGRALDVDGFASDAERAAFIEEAVSMGANGIGVYKGGSIHIDEGDFRSWDLAKKKIYQDAIARGMEKRKKIQEEKQKQANAEKVEEQKPEVKITEESGQQKAASKFGVTPESKKKMIAENQAKQAAPPSTPPPPATPLAANPAMLDPTSAQSSQKVAELSKKTTMNREASTKQGPVTQNIVNNSNPKADTTGTGFPDKNAPMMAMTDTMEKFTSHLFGVA